MNYNLVSILGQLSTINFKEIGAFTIKELWEWMFFDQENSYLNESLVIHEPSGVPIKERTIKLNEQLILTGDYYCFTYIEHQPFYHLQKVGSLDALANLILSKRGINNSFTTVTVTVIKGEVQPFLEKEKATDKELDLISEIQQIITTLHNSNIKELTTQIHNCLLKYKKEGLSEEAIYNTVHYMAKVYEKLGLDYKNNFINQLIKFLNASIGGISPSD